MPTGDEYRAGARRFRALVGRLERELIAQRGWIDELSLGRGAIRRPIDVGLAAVRTDVAGAAGAAEVLAAECERRAAVCDRFRSDWSAYWSRSWFERMASTPPARPASWVDP